MVLGRRGSDFDLAAMSLRDCSSSKYVANYFCSANPRSNRCAVPWTVTGVGPERESLRTTSHAKDGSPSLGGLTAFFDLAWTMVRFVLHAGPDDAPRMEIISKDQQDGGLPT